MESLFNTSQGLIGRDSHLREISHLYRDKNSELSRHISIRGASGVGKTSIAIHFSQSLPHHECITLFVKCFSGATHTAYYALSCLFDPLLKYLLTLEDQVVEQLKQKLTYVDNSIGPLLMPVLPDIQYLTSSEDILPGELSMAESAIRFENALLAFVNTVAPLLPGVLFIIDDIQWCDEPTINSLNNILKNQDLSNYFLISTERVNPSDRVCCIETKADLANKSIINVEELSLDDIRSMTRQYLKTCRPAVINAISERAWTLTKGNPFFLDRILSPLRDCTVDFQFDNNNDLDDYLDLINMSSSYATVLDLLTASMASINNTAMNTLAIAACIGHTFSDRALIQLNISRTESIETLNTAVAKGLLVRTKPPTGAVENNAHYYKFVHDQIQDAALQQLNSRKRAAIIYKLYCHLLNDNSDSELTHNEVTAIMKLNAVTTELNCEERVRLAKLNLEATNLNRQSSAFSDSLIHIDAIIDLSENDWWVIQHDLMAEAYIRAIEILIGMRNFERADKLILELEQHKLNANELSKITQLKIAYFIGLGNHTQALTIGSHYLKQWDLQLPTIDLEQQIEDELELATEYFSPKALDDIIKQSQHDLASEYANPMKIMVDLLVPSDAINTRLNMWLAIKLFTTTMKYGFSISSVKALANFGSTCATLGYIDRGYILGESALKICEAEQYKFIAHRAMFTFFGYLKHWRDPLQQTAISLKSIHDTSLLNGDVAYAALTSGMIGSTVYPYTSVNIFDSIAILEKSRLFCEQNGASGSLQMTLSALLPLSYMSNPKSSAESGDVFQYKNYSETEFLLQCESDKNAMAICNFRILQSLAYALEDRLIEAETSCNSAFQRCGNLYATFSKAICFFQRAFTVFSTSKSDTFRYKQNKASAKTCLDELENWQKINPHNYSCLYHLANAEYYLAQDDQETALAEYVKSISAATSSEFHLIHALVQSRLSTYWRDIKSNDFYYQEHIANTYSICTSINAIKPAAHYARKSASLDSTRLQSNYYNKHRSTQLTDDLTSFIDTSATITNETDYASMVRKMLSLLLNLTHFDAVKLFVKIDDELRLEASHDSSSFSLFQPQPDGGINSYPISLLRYVERSRETITVSNPAEQPPYSTDPYIRARQPAAIITLPVSIQANVIAILYFETAQTKISTANNVRHSLTILSSLIATSVQNILLYKSISSTVQSRTEMLNESNATLTQRIEKQEKEIDQLGKLRAFLQPHVADIVTSSDHSELLNSHRKRLSIVFCDLRGFTNFSESVEPEDVFDLLGKYHEILGGIVTEFKATIDHRAGDGLMTFVGDPIKIKDTSEHAVQMAIEMQQRISKLLGNRSLRAHDLGFGVGIATGYSNIGLIGFSGSYGYSATGRNVNLASRLCDEAKNNEILINRTAYADLREDAYTIEERIYKLKGYNTDTAVFNVKPK